MNNSRICGLFDIKNFKNKYLKIKTLIFKYIFLKLFKFLYMYIKRKNLFHIKLLLYTIMFNLYLGISLFIFL